MVSVTEAQALQCCASKAFARALANVGSCRSPAELMEAAREIWWDQVGVADWLEAFAAHPRIGDVEGLKKKYGGFADMSRGEQAGAAGASSIVLEASELLSLCLPAEAGSDSLLFLSSSSLSEPPLLKALAEWNKRYEDHFGHIFLIRASGKSAADMLEAIKSRCKNAPYKELAIAAAEQMKITELRLRSILPNSIGDSSARDAIERRSDGKLLTSPITSHVLDTARGQPAEGVQIILDRRCSASADIWAPVASGLTNSDGRVPQLLPPASSIQPGVYRVTFEMAGYMETCRRLHPDFFPARPFYPLAAVQFEVTEQTSSQHFHIPLTWNPYGYSTYRGS